MIPYELLQDLNKLACRSKNVKIESLFVKLAQEHQDDFYDWVIKNIGNKYIKARLAYKDVMRAIQYLTATPNATKEDVLELGRKNEESLLRVLASFYQLLKSDDRFKSILNRFSASLSSFSSIKLPDNIITQVAQDLESLDRDYRQSISHPGNGELDIRKRDVNFNENERTKIARQNRRARFNFLLKSFNAEVTNALQGNPRFAKVFALVQANRLPYHQEIALALPYMPNLRGKGPKILELVRMANRDLSANPRSIAVLNDMKAKAFNIADLDAKQTNTNLIKQKEMDFSKLEKEDVSDEEIRNDSSDSKNDSMTPAEYDPVYVAQSDYILIISMMLAKLWLQWEEDLK